MILREPEYEDCEFIASCYEDWPRSRKGRVFPVDVRNWINRFRFRADEKGLVGEVDGAPVGFVLFEQNLFVAKIYEIAVPIALRGMGHGKTMWRLLYDKMASEGVVVAEFEAIPGIIADMTLNGRFTLMGEGIGPKTGLPTVKGQVTAETEI